MPASRWSCADADPNAQAHRRGDNPALNGISCTRNVTSDGLGGGGNKLRKLEYLMGDAAANGCDTIIATGGIQSNFTRVVAAACAREKVACELVLSPLVPETDDEYQRSGNTLLNDLFGARTHVLGPGQAAADFAKRRAEELIAQGRRPYLTPGGGSNSISALGYVRCALELDTQLNSNGLDEAIVVTANGSNGTHAGLLAGFKALGGATRQLRAFTVLANAEASRNSTLAMANGTLDLLGASERLNLDDVLIADDQRGPGYGIRLDAMIDAVRLMAVMRLLWTWFIPVPCRCARRCARWSLSSRCIGCVLDDGGAPALYAIEARLPINRPS